MAKILYLKSVKSPKFILILHWTHLTRLENNLTHFPDLMDRADYALKLMAEGKLNLSIQIFGVHGKGINLFSTYKNFKK